MTAVRNLAGMTFGSWTVVGRSPKTDSRQNAYWLCACVCGAERAIMSGNLTRGHTTSCGCSTDRDALNPLQDRGLIGTRLYRAWAGMKNRCLNTNYDRYSDWGGRGITVYPEWVTSFDAFAAAVGPHPGMGWTLDRIDNDGNYEPGNVRWATHKMQALNRRGQRAIP